MTSRWPVMTEPHRQQIDRYRCCDGHIGKRAGNFGMMGDMVHQYRNTGADVSGRGEDKVMREVPHKGAEQTVQHGMEEIGSAHVCTPVTNAHLVCRLLLEKTKQQAALGHLRLELHTEY